MVCKQIAPACSVLKAATELGGGLPTDGFAAVHLLLVPRDWDCLSINLNPLKAGWGGKRNGGFQADFTYCGRLFGKDSLACGRERDGSEAPPVSSSQLWKWTGEAGSRHPRTKSIGPVVPDAIDVPPSRSSGRSFT